jgi:hypothetical protein
LEGRSNSTAPFLQLYLRLNDKTVNLQQINFNFITLLSVTGGIS